LDFIHRRSFNIDYIQYLLTTRRGDRLLLWSQKYIAFNLQNRRV